MKTILILFFFISIESTGICQNPDSVVIETNNMIRMIDGIPVKGENIFITPGIHNAEMTQFITVNFGDLIGYNYQVKGSNVNFNVEGGKTYTLRNFPTNFYDTTTKTNYFNIALPTLIDKKTAQIVSSIKNLIKLDPITNTCGKLYLNYNYESLDTGQFALIHLSSIVGSPCEALFLKGWTQDNYSISYINYNISNISKDDSTSKRIGSLDCNDLKIYLKPGYYWLGYNYSFYQQHVGSRGIEYSTLAHKSNSFNFLAEPGDTTIIYLTSNRANKFDNSFKAFHGDNLNSMFFLPDLKYGWIVGDNAIILSTKNGGKTWRFNQNGKRYNGFLVYDNTYNNYKDVCFIDSLTGWIAGDLGSIIHTIDGGVTWATQKTRSPLNLASNSNVHFFNERFGLATNSYISYTGANIFSTLNGGATWKLLIDEKQFAKFYAFSIDNIWKATKSEILHSTDMCQTWSSSFVRKKDSLTDNFAKRENLIYFIDPLHGWILYNGVQCTKDGGKTWGNQKINITPDLVYFINKDLGWAFGQHGIIFKTINGGENWLMLKTKNIVKDITKVCFTDENNGWAIGLYGFIYNTTDGGQNWNVLNVLDLI